MGDMDSLKDPKVNVFYCNVNISTHSFTCKWKIIYLNCGEIYEDMVDQCSYKLNLSSCEMEAWKKFRPEWDSNFVNWKLLFRY